MSHSSCLICVGSGNGWRVKTSTTTGSSTHLWRARSFFRTSCFRRNQSQNIWEDRWWIWHALLQIFKLQVEESQFKRRNNQDINQNSFGDILAFFSNSADRPVSVSISASLADTESDCDALDDCLAIWSTLVADLSVDSDKSFISSVSLCSRDLQVETAFWQYGMASWGLEAISRHKHILKLL